MELLEIFLTGVALSMDACAVSMTNSMVHREKSLRLVEMAFWFGLSQGMMPVFGYILGGAFADVISVMGKYIVVFIFCAIGGKMLQEAFMKDEPADSVKDLTHQLLLLQAFATSIDAFAIGVGFSAGGADIILAACVIAITTFLLSLAAIVIGRVFGDMLGKKAEALGGLILILLGIKSLISTFGK